MGKFPIGFMSYVRFDDEHENGRLTEFCKRLSGEVRLQTGEQFDIFQDRHDIAWGEQWKHRIGESLDATTFLLPIITPSFFKSKACREELERFLAREAELLRSDLILPLYYVNCPILNDEYKRSADPLAQLIAERHYLDWRDLRFEPFCAPQMAKMLAKLALQIAEALERRNPGEERDIGSLPAVPCGARGPARLLPAAASTSATAPDVDPHAAPRPEIRTLVVDGLHRGDFATVTEALKAARAGDRILVRPGLYAEGIVIDKPVEIIGDGQLGEVILEAIGADTVLFRANNGRIANLELRQMGGGKWHCIDIAQGRLDVEGCDISGHSLDCVAVHDGADPRVRRNRIHHGAQSGVYVYRNGRGMFEENEIFDNAVVGVHTSSGGNPICRRNGISRHPHQAVWVEHGGKGIFEENDLRENVNGAWDISPDCISHVIRKQNQE